MLIKNLNDNFVIKMCKLREFKQGKEEDALEPGTSGRDVIGGALALGLD